MRGFALALLAGLVMAGAAQAQAVYIRSDANKALNRPFSDAVQVGDILYLSGQIGAAPGQDGVVPGGMPAEAHQIMENIGAVLKSRGLSYDNVFKCTVMIADMGKWGEFNKVYVPYFKPDRLTARSAFGANGLAKGAQLEVECWATVR